MRSLKKKDGENRNILKNLFRRRKEETPAPVKTEGVKPIRSNEAALFKLNNPKSLGDLLSGLNNVNKKMSESEVHQAKREAELAEIEPAAKDFMKRYYQSDSYKRKVGGREMMQSDIGFEESALGDRLMNTPLTYDAEKGGQLLGYSAPRQFSSLDYRDPSHFAKITELGMQNDPYLTAVHELSHAQGAPAKTSWWFEGDPNEPINSFYRNSFEQIYKDQGYDRSMIVGNPSRQKFYDFGMPLVNHPVAGYDGINIENDPRRGNVKPEIAEAFGYIGRWSDGSTYEEENDPRIPKYQVNSRNRNYEFASQDKVASFIEKRINYINSPTEMAARMRAVVAHAQRQGDMAPDDFNLSYDMLRKQAMDGYGGAQDILAAIGVMDALRSEDAKVPTYHKEDEEKARAAYNRYIKDLL